MKVSRFRRGVYIITIHDKSFTLEKLAEDKYWTLYNAWNTEINRCETKSGMLQIMKDWHAEKVLRESQMEDFA